MPKGQTEIVIQGFRKRNSKMPKGQTEIVIQGFRKKEFKDAKGIDRNRYVGRQKGHMPNKMKLHGKLKLE